MYRKQKQNKRTKEQSTTPVQTLGKCTENKNNTTQQKNKCNTSSNIEVNVQKTKTKQNNKRTKYNTSSNIVVNVQKTKTRQNNKRTKYNTSSNSEVNK
jgi:hypothetical protein